jgi:hypothetical protein
MSDFQSELTDLINRHSMENASETPDFILAEYLYECLISFNLASNKRENWYGRQNEICSVELIPPPKQES